MAEELAMKLNDTAQLLYAQYGSLTVNTQQLAEILHYRSTRVLLNAISAERCPVHTFKCGKHRVADIRDIADYLDQMRGI